MSNEDLLRRLGNLESSHQNLEESLNQLNTTIALLNQTVETMSKSEEKRRQFVDRTVLFGVGGIISAVVAWIVRGGWGSDTLSCKRQSRLPNRRFDDIYRINNVLFRI